MSDFANNCWRDPILKVVKFQLLGTDA